MAWRNPNVVRIGLVLCALGYLYALGLISFTINNETQTGSQVYAVQMFSKRRTRTLLSTRTQIVALRAITVVCV